MMGAMEIERSDGVIEAFASGDPEQFYEVRIGRLGEARIRLVSTVDGAPVDELEVVFKREEWVTIRES